MRKKIICYLLLLISCFVLKTNIYAISNTEASATKSETLSPATIYAKYQDAVVAIFVDTPNKAAVREMNQIGCGFIIDNEGTIVTDNAIFDEYFNISNGSLQKGVNFYVLLRGDNKLLRASCVGRDIERDLVFLQIDASSLPNKKINYPMISEQEQPELPLVGEPIYAVNLVNPFQGVGGLATGFVSEISLPEQLEHGGELRVFTTSCFVPRDAFGGLVVNESGQAVGITTKRYINDIADKQMRFYPWQMIKEAYSFVFNEAPKQDVAWLGITVYDDQQYAVKQSLFGLRTGVYVRSVKRDTPAYVADLRVGDIIEQINGRAIRNYNDYLVAIKGKKVGDELKIKFYRSSYNHSEEATVYLKPYPVKQHIRMNSNYKQQEEK